MTLRLPRWDVQVTCDKTAAVTSCWLQSPAHWVMPAQGLTNEGEGAANCSVTTRWAGLSRSCDVCWLWLAEARRAGTPTCYPSWVFVRRSLAPRPARNLWHQTRDLWPSCDPVTPRMFLVFWRQAAGSSREEAGWTGGVAEGEDKEEGHREERVFGPAP